MTAEDIIRQRQEIDQLSEKWKKAKEHGLTLNARDKGRLLALLLADEQLGTLAYPLDVSNILGHIGGLETKLAGVIGKLAGAI